MIAKEGSALSTRYMIISNVPVKVAEFTCFVSETIHFVFRLLL